MKNLKDVGNLTGLLISIVSSAVAIIMLPRPYNFVISSAIIIFVLVSLLIIVIRNRGFGEKHQFGEIEYICKAPYRVNKASPPEMEWAISIEHEVYTGIDRIEPEVTKGWYNKNPNGFYVIKDRDGTNCGYLEVLPLKPALIEALLINGDIIEQDIYPGGIYGPDDIDKVEHLYVASLIAINGNCKPGNPIAIRTVFNYAPKIITGLCHPKNLKGFYALSASDEGASLMTKLGFNIINKGYFGNSCCIAGSENCTYVVRVMNILNYNSKRRLTFA